MDETIEEILMRRDGLSRAEAEDLIGECRERLWEALEGSGEDPEEIIAEELGLEPDYLDELIGL